MEKFDAVVVGGGPGGYECAIRLSQNGKKTALVEKAQLGGTCLNRGCIPTKALLHCADVYHEAMNGARFGVHAEKVTFNYEEMVRHKDNVAKQLRNGIGYLEKSHGVKVYQAAATLQDRHTVVLEGGETLQCDNLILATGSEPARLPIPGADLPGVVDSTGLLELTKCPEHIVIIGGGVIGIEFACFYSRLGVKVTVIEMLDRILAPLDKDISSFVATELKACGVEIITGVRVESIEEGLTVRYTGGEAKGDVVLVAGGRTPNTRNIGLEQLGVRTDRRGFVETDGLCRTSVPGVYAIGDCNGKMLLAHAASAQGMVAADHIAGLPCRQHELTRIPSCVYCSPEAAMVGLTEDQAKATGKDVGIGVFALSGNGKAMAAGENKGMMKLIFDKQTEEILGFHVVGPRATDLVAEVAAVMECEGTVSELAETVHPHPTVSEAVMETARVCLGCCVNVPGNKK